MEAGRLLFSALLFVGLALGLVVWAYILYWLVPRLIWLIKEIAAEIRLYRAMKPVVEKLSRDDRSRIFRMIEKIGNEPSRGFLAFLLDHKPKNEPIAIKLPDELPNFPWVGQWVLVTPSAKPSAVPVDFSVRTDLEADEAKFAKDIMFLKVPYFRAGGAAKRATSIFSVPRYLQMSTELSDCMATLFPRDPERLLSNLLRGDNRIGLSPQWVQVARFHKCPICRKSMRLVLQIDGMEFGGRLGEGEFYLFGCTRHPEQLVQDQDWY